MSEKYISPTKRRSVGDALTILLLTLGGGIFLGVIVTQLYKPVFRGTDVFFVNTISSYIGMGVVAIGYTLVKYDSSFFDVSPINRNDVQSIVEGGVILTAVTVLYSAFVTITGFTPPTDGITNNIALDPTVIPVFLGMVFLFNAPVEELVFRNLIQKSLEQPFTVWGAITVTSLLFTMIHIPNYTSSVSGITAKIGVPLTVIFATSVVFGYYYARSENIFVPILIHAYYNSLQFMIVLGNGI